VLSEQPSTMGPRPELFPRRNRIVSGLALGVLIIEARARSGASITARLAVEAHGRDAMAVPGRVDSPTSEGALRALREGWAALVTSPDDVIAQLASSSHLVRGANDLAHACAARTRPAGGRSADVAERSIKGAFSGASSGALRGAVDRAALPPAVTRVAERIAAAGSLTVETAIDGDPVHEVLAAITTLEVLGLVRRDAQGVIHARSG
jgi:predicted Rossmann fold nucleotide-binding protein DprA/Smf involved in DNA uptake